MRRCSRTTRRQFHGDRDILLLSDGDDPAHDGEWREGAAEAREQGVPIYTVGLGDPDDASVIRIDGKALKHGGNEVRTRLEEAPLRDIAEMTHGVYFPAYTRTLPLGKVYINAIAGKSRREESDNALPGIRPALSVVFGGRFRLHGAGGRDRRASPRHGSDWRNRRPGHFPCTSEGAVNNKLSKICLILFAALSASAESSLDWQTLLRQGDAAYARGDYAAAATLYDQAGDRTTDPGLVAFDLAAAQYRLALASDADRAPLAREAEQSYRCCIAPGDTRRAQALYGLGNALLLRADGHDADALRAAVEAYQQCLTVSNIDNDLADNARHNLERARLLLLQVPPLAAHRKDELSGDAPPKPQPSPPEPARSGNQNTPRRPARQSQIRTAIRPSRRKGQNPSRRTNRRRRERATYRQCPIRRLAAAVSGGRSATSAMAARRIEEEFKRIDGRRCRRRRMCGIGRKNQRQFRWFYPNRLRRRFHVGPFQIGRNAAAPAQRERQHRQRPPHCQFTGHISTRSPSSGRVGR